MKVWEIIVEAKDVWGNENSYTYRGVAKTVTVANRQALRLAKKDFTCVEIVSARCLGDLDFCTKR